MESMMLNLPDDMFRAEILQYLTVHDVVKLDNACMNHIYRPQLMEKISGVILIGDKDRSIKASLFKWLGMRRIYWIKMNLPFGVDYTFPSSIENDYMDQFRYTQQVVMRKPMRDDMAIFIISHCPCLFSIDISQKKYRMSLPSINSKYYYTGITDQALQSIAEHCIGLQSLSLSCCSEITDTGLINISEHCHNLQSLKINDCRQVTDASIISISAHCTGLQSLNLWSCDQITDASIISLSTHCTGLHSLHLLDCRHITDTSIISVSTYCTGLQSLNLKGCHHITDASIMSISTHCTGLQSLNLNWCLQITDASIIPISQNCTVLNSLDVYHTKITDASLIAIAKNCTGLQTLYTFRCQRLSSYKLRFHFKSLSELRAVLLSIYPSLPI